MIRLETLFAGLFLLAGAAHAADDEPSPNASEKTWIANCLAKNGESEPAMRACVGVVLGACLGVEKAPKSIQPSDTFSHPRSCAPVEEKIWDGYLNRWYGEATKTASPELKAALREAQRAWIAYRLARCNVETELNPFPLGEDNRATCMMEETARRALELRVIATQR